MTEVNTTKIYNILSKCLDFAETTKYLLGLKEHEELNLACLDSYIVSLPDKGNALLLRTQKKYLASELHPIVLARIVNRHLAQQGACKIPINYFTSNGFEKIYSYLYYLNQEGVDKLIELHDFEGQKSLRGNFLWRLLKNKQKNKQEEKQTVVKDMSRDDTTDALINIIESGYRLLSNKEVSKKLNKFKAKIAESIGIELTESRHFMLRAATVQMSYWLFLHGHIATAKNNMQALFGNNWADYPGRYRYSKKRWDKIAGSNGMQVKLVKDRKLLIVDQERSKVITNLYNIRGANVSKLSQKSSVDYVNKLVSDPAYKSLIIEALSPRRAELHQKILHATQNHDQLEKLSPEQQVKIKFLRDCLQACKS